MDERVTDTAELTSNEPEGATAGWFFLDPRLVPERWKDRVQSAAFVPLLPAEAAQILDGGAALKSTDLGDDEFLHLVAQGLPARTIGRRLGISTRSVHRRLARLREIFEVESTAELAAALSKRGF